MRAYIYELVCSKFLWCSVIGLYLCLVTSTAGTLSDGSAITVVEYIFSDRTAFSGFNFGFEYVLFSFNSQILAVIYPLVAGFATVTLFCDKRAYKYSVFVNIRKGSAAIAIYELSTSFITMAICSVLAYTGYAITIISVFPIRQLEMSQLFISAILLSLVMLVGNLLSLICATIVPNKYFALFVPMFLLYLLRGITDSIVISVISSEGIGEKAYILELLSPFNYLNLYSSGIPVTLKFIIPGAVILIISAISFACLYISGRRCIMR